MSRRRRLRPLVASVALLLSACPRACCPGTPTRRAPAARPATRAASPATTDAPPTTGDPTATTGTTGDDTTGTATTRAATTPPAAPTLLCPTDFRFDPPAGATALRVAGEWQGFDLATATAMTGPTASGVFTAHARAPAGPARVQGRLRAQGGAHAVGARPGRRAAASTSTASRTAPSGARLQPARRSSVEAIAATRPAPGQGAFTATLRYVDGVDGAGADAAALRRPSLRNGDDERRADRRRVAIDARRATSPLASPASPTASTASRSTAQPKSGARRRARCACRSGSRPSRSRWNDALIYMVMTDRYRDGDPATTPAPTPSADPRGDWQGGDLEGLRAGDRGRHARQARRARDLAHAVPDQPRGRVPRERRRAQGHRLPRLLADQGARGRPAPRRRRRRCAALVSEAHAHGIRILQDYVINHVHEEHEYVAAHPEWFRTGLRVRHAGLRLDGEARSSACSPTTCPTSTTRVPEANAAVRRRRRVVARRVRSRRPARRRRQARRGGRDAQPLRRGARDLRARRARSTS